MERFDCFKVKVKYHRTDDLKKNSPSNNSEILVQIYWKNEDNDLFPNEWIFMPSRYIHWIPERDLKILQKVSLEEYIKDREKGLIYDNKRRDR